MILRMYFRRDSNKHADPAASLRHQTVCFSDQNGPRVRFTMAFVSVHQSLVRGIELRSRCLSVAPIDEMISMTRSRNLLEYASKVRVLYPYSNAAERNCCSVKHGRFVRLWSTAGCGLRSAVSTPHRGQSSRVRYQTEPNQTQMWSAFWHKQSLHTQCFFYAHCLSTMVVRLTTKFGVLHRA
jgi:hypothetical protein